MIVIQLNGGLGNQLFQYALGRKLALCRGSELRFDLTAFNHHDRQFKLGYYNVFGSPSDPSELKNNLWLGKRPLYTRPLEYFDQLRPYYLRHKITEPSIIFDENILKAPRDVYLSGYWQTEKYFKDIRPILLKEITLKNPLSRERQRLMDKILGCESVSLHIRRGDYVTNPRTHAIHGVLSFEYYQEAIRIISSQIETPEFFVFSDDIAWTKKEMKIQGRINFIEDSADDTDHEDLMLMSHCKHHITANSSFSWWGAWLCQTPGKKVIAPKKWYKIDIDTSDLIPDDWMRI